MQTYQSPLDGIRKHTSDASNQRIDHETQEAMEQIEYSPELIRARLDKIDREWNVDRALMLNFAVLASFSASMAMRNVYRHGKLGVFGAAFFTQMAFLAHHAIRRWCPPLPVFRRLGFRSDHEISAERVALLRRLDQLTSL
jgi:hypothetical protein